MATPRVSYRINVAVVALSVGAAAEGKDDCDRAQQPQPSLPATFAYRWLTCDLATASSLRANREIVTIR